MHQAGTPWKAASNSTLGWALKCSCRRWVYLHRRLRRHQPPGASSCPAWSQLKVQAGGQRVVKVSPVPTVSQDRAFMVRIKHPRKPG